MLKIKAFSVLSIPTTVFGYSLALNLIEGSSFLSLPISAILFVLCVIISVIALIYVSEEEEKSVVKEHLGL